ncbi:phage tail assembly protein [Gordonia sp. X0973]|uniref:phage tail assembly protein n=1 Tax=Gordonia sp. X0973 TaxID=2742602 RepID=UPI000F5305BA|nr:phage tail assembly protein [Gordonia sp. X0973]QKT07937.1 phage tail assembly protein [Gordonia sp. X0973]
MSYYQTAQAPAGYTAAVEPPKSAITLDYLREKTDEEYAPYHVDMGDGILTLRNPLQLNRDKRQIVQQLIARLTEIQDELKELGEDDDQPEGVEDEMHNIMLGVIEASADNSALAARLCEELAQNLGMTQVVFYDWFGVEEAGEASDSPS